MTEHAQTPQALWSDAKFRWLILSVTVVGALEFLSLAGWQLRPELALPMFAGIVLAIGYSTLASGMRALAGLNFRSINLLMLIAVAGAFYLGEYEEAAVVIVLFMLGGRGDCSGALRRWHSTCCGLLRPLEGLRGSG